MEEQIYDLLKAVQNGEQSIGDAQSQLLLLFSVSCQCDACKQDRIDSNYRKYIELNKNVIGYD
jgi:hypothetical protein